MKAALRLSRAWAAQHRLRAVLTIAAVALAASLVVFTLDAYRAAIDYTTGFAREVLGRYDLVVVPTSAMQPNIDRELAGALHADDRVETLERVSTTWVDVEDTRNTTYYESWRCPVFGTDRAEPPVAIAQGSWLEQGSDEPVAVLSGGLARRWRASLGQVLQVDARGGSFAITVRGITDEHLAQQDASGLFVTPALARRVAGREPTGARLFVALAPGSDTAAFLAEWQPRLAAADPPATGKDLNTIAAELATDKAIAGLRTWGLAAAAIAFLAAGFIVFATVSAGTDERARQLALLRCIGASKAQVASAVLAEGLLFALCGAAAGIPLGWLWVQLLAWIRPALYPDGVSPGLVGPLAAIAAAVFAAVFAGLLPARAASRHRPIEAMSGLGARARGRGRPLATIAGVILLVVHLVLAATAPAASHRVANAMTGAALIAIVCAALLLVPALIVCVERLFAPVVARCLALPTPLLRQQLSGRLGRSAGTVLTLAICLGLSVTLNVWGRTMVTPFLPSPDLPDTVVSVMPAGLPSEAADAVRELPGVDGDRVLPMAVEQTALGGHLLAASGGDLSQAYVLIVGVDPRAAFTSDDPLLPLEFADGDAASGIAALERPGACLVPPAFAKRFDLRIGDPVPLRTPAGATREEPLVVGGIASLPGWHWVTKFSRMRTLGGKPLAPLVVHRDTAAALGIGRIRHWYIDQAPDYDRAELRTALQRLAEAHAGAYVDAHFGPGMARGVSVKVIDTIDVRDRMKTRADGVIWILGALPLTALLVAILGVANAIAAGIRVRTWEFGVLRSVGLEADTAGRLVLGEALLLALAAAVLSVPAGILTARAGIILGVQAYNTGTALPGTVIPWLDIVIAVLITAAVALLAALLPARRLARRQPLDLLQQGRGAG